MILAGWLLLTGTVYAWGEESALDEARELGHHWEIPAVAHEMHFQMIAMLVIAILYGVGSYLHRKTRNRPKTITGDSR
jgi:hypothetical protein